MFDLEALKDLLARTDLSNRQKILICLAVEPVSTKKVDEIRVLAVNSGLRAAAKWNISDHLSKSKGFAILTPNGWELTAAGRVNIASLVGPLLPSVSVLVLSALRNQLATIQNIDTRHFVIESIRCLEARLYRAAILTSWVGAVSMLYDVVVQKNLAEFNMEAVKRDQKWRVAKNTDDLSRMKEFDFLQIIVAIGLIGKNVKEELEVCLKLRNGCGHPNSLVVGEHRASAHIETLIQNVFSKF